MSQYYIKKYAAPRKKLIHSPRTELGTKNELNLVTYKEIVPNFKIKIIHPPENVSFPLKRDVLFEKVATVDDSFIKDNILLAGSDIYLTSPHDFSIIKMTIIEFQQYSVSGSHNLFFADNKSDNYGRINNYGTMDNFLNPKYVFGIYKNRLRISCYISYSEKEALENLCNIYIPDKIAETNKIPHNRNSKSVENFKNRIEKLKKLKHQLEKYVLTL